MEISLIAAVAENNVIGGGNAMLWHIPEDFKYFKSVTIGKPIIMGRKTFDSIGRPLPGRLNIVITRQTGWVADGVTVAPSLEDAIKTAEKTEASEAMVIGGAQIYAAALPFATTIYLTHIQKGYTGDAVFPPVDVTAWREVSRDLGQDCAKVGTHYEFTVYKRITP
jgi:dihydrofolate reductase